MERIDRRRTAAWRLIAGPMRLGLRRIRNSSGRIVVALAGSAALVLVAPGDPTRAVHPAAGGAVLGLEDALGRALAHNKDLAAFGYRISEEEGRREQAGLPPNPSLDVFLEDAVGSGTYDGFDRAQTTLSLGWVLEGWVRQGRVEVADAGVELVGADARILRIEVAADTAEHFLSSLVAQAQLERSEEAIALAERTVAAVTRRVRAGKAPSAELARAEAELAKDRLHRDDVLHELAAAYHRLAAQWGETEPGFSRVAGDVLALPTVEPRAALAARLERSPHLDRYAKEERLAKANLRLAEARRWPALRPHVGVRRYEATDDQALVAGFAVPIPLLDRNQGEIAETRASVSRTRAEAGAARVKLQTALFELYEELQHHLHRAEALRGEVIPRLETALAGTRRAYERGRYGYLEFHAVQADLLRAQLDLVDACAGTHRLVIAIERLTGERVVRR